MPKLLYQGHSSFRLTTDDGWIVYVDPNAGEGYDIPADIILVTHQHSDHNQIQKCAQKDGCRIITNNEALEGGKHNAFDINGIKIQAVRAKSIMHSPKKCVGYIITIDGVKLYASGDTSKTAQMESFAALKLDYAMLPGAGFLSMGPKEAAACARIIGAKHNILIHHSPFVIFDRDKAEKWDAPGKLVPEPGQEITLSKEEE